MYKNIFLLKNIPEEDSLVKKEIKLFILKDLKIPTEKEYFYVRFYRYTWGTSCFLEHEEDDGGPTSTHFLDRYDEGQIASFIILKCKKDTTKFIGELEFENNYGLFCKPDTLIYTCK